MRAMKLLLKTNGQLVRWVALLAGRQRLSSRVAAAQFFLLFHLDQRGIEL